MILGQSIVSKPPRRPLPITASYDFTGGELPAGASIARASGATYFDDTGTLQTVAANVARFGYDLVRPDQGAALLLEPAGQNWAKNDTLTGAVVASDLTSFNTTTGQNSGTWGTLPANCGLVIPSLSDGSTSGWQVADAGVTDGEDYVTLRFQFTNAAAFNPALPTSGGKLIRFLFTLASGAGVPAAQGQTWTISSRVALLAGALNGGGIRGSLRSLDNGTFVEVLETGFPPPTDVDSFGWATATLDQVCTNMSAGVSLDIPAATSVDVTLKFRTMQIEQAPWPTSLIPSNNSAYPTRAADTLTLTAPITTGPVYARISTRWKNYDVDLTAAGGEVSFGIPAQAVLDGNTAVTGVLLSSGPLPPDDRRLRWAPMPLGEYVQTVTAPYGGHYMPVDGEISPVDGHAYGVNDAYEDVVDVVLTIPPGLTGPLKVVGGNSVRIIGGALIPNDNASNWSPTRSILAFYGTVSEIFIEGLYIRGDISTIERDAIDASGQNGVDGTPNTPNLIVQNSRGDGLHGSSNQTTYRPDGTIGNHTDWMQPFGPMGNFMVDRNSVWSSYQGITPIPAAAMGQTIISRTNIGYQAYDPTLDLTHPYFIWLAALANGSWPGGEMHEVYTSPRQTDFTAQGAWPSATFDDPTAAAIPGQGDITIAWPARVGVNGCVRLGPPPGGDFCPTTACGVNYKSPGYGWTP